MSYTKALSSGTPGRTGAPDRRPKPQHSSTIFSLSPHPVSLFTLPCQKCNQSLFACPLQEVVGGLHGITRVHTPFSLSDLNQCRTRLGRFSEDPSRFTEEFQALTLSFDFTWKDVNIVLSHCCTSTQGTLYDMWPRLLCTAQTEHIYFRTRKY